MSSQPRATGQAAVARTALDGIGAQARRSNQARVRQLSAALSSLAKGELSLLECQRSVEVAHQLVGSAGTFGYARVSELGRQLELFFSSGARGDAREVDAVARALVRMQQDLTLPAAEVAELS